MRESFLHRMKLFCGGSKMALACALGLSLTACSKEVSMPAAMTGIWTTEATKYQACYLDIRPRQIHIGTADGKYEVGVIRVVDVGVDGKGTLYSVEYSGAGGTRYSVALYYDAVQDVIRIKNQEHIVWVRTEERHDDV